MEGWKERDRNHVGGFKKRQIFVIGAGAQGLTAAYLLLREGYNVKIFFEKIGVAPPHALWELPPFRVDPEELVVSWALSSFGSLLSLHRKKEDCGVLYPVPSYLVSRSPFEPNKYSSLLPNYRKGPSVLKEKVLQDACADAHSNFRDAEAYDTIVIDTNRYFSYLQEEIRKMGGEMIQKKIQSLSLFLSSEECEGVDWVVNCSGLGALTVKKTGEERKGGESGEGARDQDVFPIRGEIVLCESDRIHCTIIDIETGSYVIPNPYYLSSHLSSSPSLASSSPLPKIDLEIGGTAIPNQWERTLCPATQEEILNKAESLIGRENFPTKSEGWCGLRPGRKGGVRFEVERVVLEKKNETKVANVVHCFGHGGAGIITAFGCAFEILTLVSGRHQSKL